MTSPLPRRSPPQPVPHEGRDGVPWTEYVRKVEFIDREPPGPESPPVHVTTAPVLFDGVIAAAGISRDGMTIDVSGREATIVTISVMADDVQIGSTSAEDPFVPHLIGGRHVHTPVGEGWDWVPEDPDRPEGFIVCSFYVAEVHVR